MVVALLVTDDTYVVEPGSGPAGSAASAPATTAAGEPARATAVLAELEAALGARDPEAAAAAAAPGDEAAASLLSALAANAAALDVRDLALRLVDVTGPTSPEGRWSAAVDAAWGFGGFDDAPARAELVVTFAGGAEDAGIVSFDPAAATTPGSGRLPVWLAGPVEVRRTPETLVVAARGAGDVEALSRLARAAVPQVREVLPEWSEGLVVEVPGSPEGLRAALAAEAGDYDGVAAVTASVDGSNAPGSPVHVFVNPTVFGGLEPQGAQVVMTHEATHVATDAPTTAVPLWLLEGFADFVALREVELPLRTTAGQVIAQVREDGPPAALPGPEEFDTADTHLGATYEAAWLAAVVLADTVGAEGLVEVYRRVSGGEPVEAVLGDVAGFGVEELTRRWRARLSDLAA